MKIKFVYLLLFLNFIVLHNKIYNQNLPIKLTQEEQEILNEYYNNIPTSKGYTTPPTSLVRAMAEWEEIAALTITWTSYTSVLKEIVRNAVQECKVIIFCTDSNVVRNNLSSSGIPLTNVRCIQTQFNSVWIRDYGANNVYTNIVDSLLLVDWVYNRPRPYDDAIPSVLASKLNLPLYQTTVPPYKLIATGGNFMTDGWGRAFSEKLILDENSPSGGYNQNLTEADIDTIMSKFMGIKKYIKINNLPYDGIHHIDMHMKLLDEETILVGKYPNGVADGPQIEANLLYIINNTTTQFGTPWKIVRIPMPPDNSTNPPSYPDNGGDYLTYTNSVFANKTIIIPTYYQQYDTIALRIYRENLPGYKVVGINCNSTIPAGGAIHCITNCVGTKDPLYISYKKIEDTFDEINPYHLEARIVHKSGIMLADLYYRTDTTQPYIAIPMLLIDTANNIWSASIPAQPAGTTVYYYVSALANNGKQQVKPITAPNGYNKFKILPLSSINEEKSLTLEDPFPNPTKAITCIPLNSNYPINVSIELTDITGKLLETIFQGEIKGSTYHFFDASKYSSGIYLIKVVTNNNIYHKKIAIRK